MSLFKNILLLTLLYTHWPHKQMLFYANFQSANDVTAMDMATSWISFHSCMKKKGELSDSLVVGARADLSFSKIADLIDFSLSTISMINREWSEKVSGNSVSTIENFWDIVKRENESWMCNQPF